MPNYAFLFAGSGENVTAPKHLYSNWKARLGEMEHYSTFIMSGVGAKGFTKTKTKIPLHSKKLVTGSSFTGKGWSQNLIAAMAYLKGIEGADGTEGKPASHIGSAFSSEADAAAAAPTGAFSKFAASKPRRVLSRQTFHARSSRRLLRDSAPVQALPAPKKFVLIGLSRGGVQAIVAANIIARLFPRAQIFLYTMDPVAGPSFKAGEFLAAKKTSFDNNEFRELAKQFSLTGKFYKTVPPQVKAHINVLMQFDANFRPEDVNLAKCFLGKKEDKKAARKKLTGQRFFKPGFLPLCKNAQNIDIHPEVKYEEYLLIGAHAHAGKSVDSQSPAGLCSEDLFWHKMHEHQFSAHGSRLRENVVIEAYSSMVVGDVTNPHFSFVTQHLKASKNASKAAASSASSASSASLPSSASSASSDTTNKQPITLLGAKNSALIRGRERLLPTPLSMEHGYVNERHQELVQNSGLQIVFNEMIKKINLEIDLTTMAGVEDPGAQAAYVSKIFQIIRNTSQKHGKYFTEWVLYQYFRERYRYSS